MTKLNIDRSRYFDKILVLDKKSPNSYYQVMVQNRLTLSVRFLLSNNGPKYT